MGIDKNRAVRGGCSEPTSLAILAQPLEFIHDDHLRERHICAMIDEIAQHHMKEGAVRAVLNFLTNELPLHLQDEEEDIFPLLMRRCEPEDEIELAISKLTVDHAHAGADIPKIVEILEKLDAEGAKPNETESSVLTHFIAHSRRHLILENAVILPLARARLTDADLNNLSIRMGQRRSVKPPQEKRHEEHD
ncbi:hemerythrin domain-containing protein [Cochlodiniinecator piscidefendens]|uniref:hemerythrin domain-containing protein n=1 Tax=Cochlodiniinecator piscidefendens TaxID=2715756 RepID=UPI00140DFC05|nr:hemerythrin domain-containing protein [Cochlodiniinecator piscidefendens]